MNYYNDNDPRNVEWLRELIRCGHIPAGRVDGRSIDEVQPGDLEGFTSCHFFAGIGGWALALRLAGWPDELPVWTGSCPCQPFSCAGKQKGKRDKRHVWPHFKRLIAERRPAVVFGEQVASPLGRLWLSGVRVDLEALVYAVGAADLCAAGVSAPHIRQRLFWVADAIRERRGKVGNHHACNVGAIANANGSAFGLDNTFSARLEGHPGNGHDGNESERNATQPTGPIGEAGPVGRLADGAEVRRGQGNPDKRGSLSRIKSKEERPRSSNGFESGGLAHADGGIEGNGAIQRSGQHGQRAQDTSAGRLADASDLRGAKLRLESRQREEGTAAHSAEHEITGPWDDAVWHLCTDEKCRRISPQPALFPLANGFPGRVGILRGAGNAIVPQLASEFIAAYVETLG